MSMVNCTGVSDVHITAWGKRQENVGQEAMRAGRQVFSHWRLREAPLSATNVPEHQNDIRSPRAHKPSQRSKVGPKSSSLAKFYADPSKACMRIDAAGARTRFWFWLWQEPKSGSRFYGRDISTGSLPRTRIWFSILTLQIGTLKSRNNEKKLHVVRI